MDAKKQIKSNGKLLWVMNERSRPSPQDQSEQNIKTEMNKKQEN